MFVRKIPRRSSTGKVGLGNKVWAWRYDATRAFNDIRLEYPRLFELRSHKEVEKRGRKKGCNTEDISMFNYVQEYDILVPS